MAEEINIMNDFTNNNNSSDSSIFQGKICPEDLNKAQEVNELKGVTEELFKKIELQKQEYEGLGKEASSEIQGMFTPVMLGDDNPTDGGIVEETLAELGKFFQSLLSEFEIELDPKTYEMINGKREKNWLAAIIKFLHDKLKELVEKVFSCDLSFDERVDKEIKELEEKLLSGGFSKEEEVAVLGKLEALRELKLKLQMAVAGWIVAMVAEIFAVELVVAAEGTGTAKEEDKKAEKTSSKKEVEVCKEIGIKVGEDEKLRILPISLFLIPARGQSNRLIIPPLKPEEQNLLRDSLKKMIHGPEHDVNRENCEVKETKVEENKQVEELIAVRPTASGQPATNSMELKDTQRDNSDWKEMKGQGKNNTCKKTLRQSNRGFVSNDNTSRRPAQSSVFSRETPEQLAQEYVFNGEASTQHTTKSVSNRGSSGQPMKGSVVGSEYDFSTWSNAEYEAQQSSVNNAQPTSECNDVKVNNHVNSMGRAQGEAQSR